eukprot:TRINITY_DN11434_c0_g1_i1.p1 TRINITY_DN11434_c0_g1~~TRINITY_DN11434_c0_g1_i1.p1  ORF type:complete len:217 (-),score=21.09 TRINITY_DN11434_c0_g1_i1:119-769(-)
MQDMLECFPVETDLPPGDRFVFYSKSADKKPGKGNHEFASNDYEELAKFPHWRKVLSNFYVLPNAIKPDVMPERAQSWTYKSAEHAYHSTRMLVAASTKGTTPSSKMKLLESAALFSLHSGSELSQTTDGGKIKKAGGKNGLVRMTTEQLANWNRRGPRIIKMIWKSKFERNESCKRLLLATNKAHLYHLQTRRGKPSVLERWLLMEELRDEFSES